MTLLDRVKMLCKKKGVSQGKMEKEIGISNGASSKWKSSSPSMEILQKLSSYFEVSVDYLMTGTDENVLSDKDNRDIAKDMENIRNKLMNGTDGPLSYDGDPVSTEDAELLLGQIELMMRRLKPINKEKYNPNKNKK
jgi:transcriptional regulator with XRE-family HTH domain